MSAPANPLEAGLTGRQKIAVAVVDLLVLAELTLAMYVAHGSESFEMVFVCMFLGALAPTLLAGRYVIRRLGERPA